MECYVAVKMNETLRNNGQDILSQKGKGQNLFHSQGKGHLYIHTHTYVCTYTGWDFSRRMYLIGTSPEERG